MSVINGTMSTLISFSSKMSAEDSKPVQVSDEVKSKLRKQLEFYFGDSNFPNDNFLKTKSSEHELGFIPLSVIATFKRIQSLCEDISVLAESVENSDVVELNEDKTMIKRKHPVPEGLDQSFVQRCVYFSKFEKEVTIDELEEALKDFGKVNSIRLLKKNKEGTGFIEFATVDEANAFLEKKEVELLGQKVNLSNKKDFFNTTSGKKRSREEKDEDKKNDELEFKEGVIVKFSGIPEEKKNDKGPLKEYFSKFGKVNYLDYRPEEALDGHVRFDDPESAKNVVAQAETEKFGDAALTLTILQGDDEKAYWEKLLEFNRKKKSGFGRRGKRGRGGRGRGGRS